MPLGVLEDGRPRFSPALPPDRLAAIDRLGFGRFEKVVLTFDRAFWRTAGLPHLMLFPRDQGESTMWVIGHDAFGAGPALVFFIFHGEPTSASARRPAAAPDAVEPRVPPHPRRAACPGTSEDEANTP